MAETTAATVQEEVLSYYDEWLRRFSERLAGLSEDEYLWEPVPGSWSVRPTPEGPQVDRLEPDPDPAPITTIVWRLGTSPSSASRTTRPGSSAARRPT